MPMNVWFLVLFVTSVTSALHISQLGPVPYCNKNPQELTIPSLSEQDQNDIFSMEQVQVFLRHGSRTMIHSLHELFPDISDDILFACNITTATHRNPSPNLHKPYHDTISLQKQFVAGEQSVEGNCESGQSAPDLFLQHSANAQHIIDAYIGTEAHHLFNNETLSDYVSSLRTDPAQPQDLALVQVISTNTERTLSSASVFLSALFNVWDDDVEFPIYAHDVSSDPLRAYNSRQCPNAVNYYKSKGESSAAFKKLNDSEHTHATGQSWKEETCADFNLEFGMWMLAGYCYGLELPISEELFWNAKNVSYQYAASIFHNHESSQETCQLLNAPLAQNIYEQLQSHKHPITVYSYHDTSMMILLESLGIFDGIHPIFADMTLLEVYQLKNGKEAFRWVRNGEFLPFPGCTYAENSQLCELQVLHDALSAFMAPLKQWEPYCANVTDSYMNGLTSDPCSIHSNQTVKNTSDFGGRDGLMLAVGLCLGLFIGAVPAGILYLKLQKKRQNDFEDTSNNDLIDPEIVVTSTSKQEQKVKTRTKNKKKFTLVDHSDSDNDYVD